MTRHSENKDPEDTLEKIIGLGERSVKKSYYPQLKDKITKLEENQKYLEEKTAALMNILEDLDQEKAAHEELLRLFNLTWDLLSIVDFEGRFVMVSPSWFRHTGYRENELTGRNVMDFVHPEDLGAVNEAFLEIKDGHSITDFDNRFICSDGSVIWFSWNAEPVPDRRIIVVAAHDVTERRITEDSLRRMNKKMNLLSGITRHDLSNKLTVSRGYLELIREKSTDTETIEICRKAELSLLDLDREIGFMKEYESLGDSEPSWESVEECLDEVLGTVDTGDIEVNSDMEGIYIYADRMCRKVFFNLLNNSLQHGGQNLSVISIEHAVSDGELGISVSDDGVGIPAGAKKKIFERGYGKNQGFGLFLSKEILGITGISLSENGIPGNGVRFEIHVPAGLWKKEQNAEKAR